MKGEFRQSRLAMRSLAYFMGVMQDCPVVLDIEKGGIDGPVNNLTINTLKCKDLYSGVELEIGGHLKDICIIPQASLTVDLQRLAFDTPSLEKLIGAFTPDSVKLGLDRYAQGVQAELSGSLRGPLNSPSLDIRLNTTAGKLELKGSTDGIMDPQKPISYDGRAVADELDLKRLIGADALGPTSILVRSCGSIPLDGSQPLIQLDTISIGKLTLLDYPYSDITAKGQLKEGIFNGWVNCQDRNLKFLFSGGVSIEANNFTYGRFFLNIDLTLARAPQ